MSWTVVNADQLGNYYNQQQGQANNPYAAYYNQYNTQQQAANNQTPQIIQLKANPWDSNPPPGTTPNLVWPQNTTPFQTQGGTAPWPNYNQQSLVPQYMAGHGIPGNHPHCQPQAGAQVHTNFNIEKPSKNNNNVNNNKNNSNLNKGGHNLTTCPCCGNMTFRENIKPGYDKAKGGGEKRGGASSSETVSSSVASLYNPTQGAQSFSSTKPCPVHGYTNIIPEQQSEQSQQQSEQSQQQSQQQSQNNYTKYYEDQMRAYQQSIIQSMMSATNNNNKTVTVPPPSPANSMSNNSTPLNAQQQEQISNIRGISGFPTASNTITQRSVREGSSGSESAPIQGGAPQGGGGNMVNNAYHQSMENWRKAQQLHENIQKWQNMQHQQMYYGQPEAQKVQGGNGRHSRRKHHTEHSQASTVSSRKDTDLNSFTSL